MDTICLKRNISQNQYCSLLTRASVKQRKYGENVSFFCQKKKQTTKFTSENLPKKIWSISIL